MCHGSDTYPFVDEFHGPDGVSGSDSLCSVLHCDVIICDTAILGPVSVTFALNRTDMQSTMIMTLRAV